MSLLKLLTNISLPLALVSCNTTFSKQDLTAKLEKGPNYEITTKDFYDSPYVNITKYHPVNGSKKTLIHLRQIHFVSKEFNEEVNGSYLDTVVSYPAVNKVQREIYFLLNHLREKGVNEIWSEKLIDSETDKFLPEEEYNAIFSYLAKTGLFTKELASGKTDSMKFIPGADLLLAMTAGYKILPGENFLLRQKAVDNLKSGRFDYNIIFTSREDYLVGKIAGSSKDYGFFIFGAHHDFSDNIKVWNLNNPDKQVSFIELTPKSYPQE